MNTIEWTRRALKQLKKIHSAMQPIIISEVDKLVDFSELPNVLPLTNHQYQYRLRVGGYRVFFNHAEQVKIIKIEEVEKRDERTY